ncbi:helix-turn-helix domain-containing protein [Bacillus luteus]|uniref:Helix-turn-helix domain-containing protein n=1 Tax=Alkalicoccus luteus TaxID=1237094 RepID=A0A969PUS7_9BACI|nr:helix-turn-helix transcriptional regulator [Alkalicoccus luteus]NJP37894.1 helix-turn-helix domain-containing protein [Alkalicoccus luteus]
MQSDELRFGDVMKIARKRAGMTQEKMAQLMHRSRSSVVKMENNQQVIDVNDFKRWMNLTNAKDMAVIAIAGLDPAMAGAVIETINRMMGAMVTWIF